MHKAWKLRQPATENKFLVLSCVHGMPGAKIKEKLCTPKNQAAAHDGLSTSIFPREEIRKTQRLVRALITTRY
jgi:hypothetical protein